MTLGADTHICIQMFADKSNSNKPGAHWPLASTPGLKISGIFIPHTKLATHKHEMSILGTLWLYIQVLSAHFVIS